MIDVSPFWRTLNASGLYIVRSCENFTRVMGPSLLTNRPMRRKFAPSVRRGCPRGMDEMERTTEGIENELKLLEEKIGEVKRRLPAHSVKPPIMMELLELEDRRDVLLKILEKLKPTDR